MKTVKELKEYLSRFNDEDKVVIAIGSFYRVYPLAYVEANPFFNVPNEVRIGASLPENILVRERKTKKP